MDIEIVNNKFYKGKIKILFVADGQFRPGLPMILKEKLEEYLKTDEGKAFPYNDTTKLVEKIIVDFLEAYYKSKK